MEMESLQVEVKIELGHKASCKETLTPEGFTHDWVVFVRGPESCDISHFVDKVVFHLHESFTKPKRGKEESSCGRAIKAFQNNSRSVNKI